MNFLHYFLALLFLNTMLAATEYECKVNEIDILTFKAVVCQQPILLDSLDDIKIKLTIDNIKLLTMGNNEITIDVAKLQPINHEKLNNGKQLKLGTSDVETTVVIPIKFIAITINSKNHKLLTAIFPLLRGNPIQKAKLVEINGGGVINYKEHKIPEVSIIYPTNNNGLYKYEFQIISPTMNNASYIQATYKDEKPYQSKTCELIPDDLSPVNLIYLQLYQGYINTNEDSYDIQSTPIVFIPLLNEQETGKEIKFDSSNTSRGNILSIDAFDYKIKNFMLNYQNDAIEVLIMGEYIFRKGDVKLVEITDPTKLDEVNIIEVKDFATYSNLSQKRIDQLISTDLLKKVPNGKYEIQAMDKKEGMENIFFQCFGGKNLGRQLSYNGNPSITITNGGFYYYRFPISKLNDNSKLKIKFHVNPTPQKVNTNIKFVKNKGWKIENKLTNDIDLAFDKGFILEKSVSDFKKQQIETIDIELKNKLVSIIFSKRVVDNLTNVEVTFGNNNKNIIMKNDEASRKKDPSILKQFPVESNDFKMILDLDLIDFILNNKDGVVLDEIKEVVALEKIQLSFNDKSGFADSKFYLNINTNYPSASIPTREIKLIDNHSSVIKLDHKVTFYEIVAEVHFRSMQYLIDGKISGETSPLKKPQIEYALAISELEFRKNKSLIKKIIDKIGKITGNDYLLLCTKKLEAADVDASCLFKYNSSNKVTVNEKVIPANKNQNGLLFTDTDDSDFETDTKLITKVSTFNDNEEFFLTISKKDKNGDKGENSEHLQILINLLQQLTKIKHLHRNIKKIISEHFIFKKEIIIDEEYLKTIKNVETKEVILKDSKNNIIPDNKKFKITTYNLDGLYFIWNFPNKDTFIIKKQKNLVYNCKIFGGSDGSGINITSLIPIEVNFTTHFAPLCYNTEFSEQISVKIDGFHSKSFYLTMTVQKIDDKTKTKSLSVIPSLVSMNDNDIKSKTNVDSTPLQKLVQEVKKVALPGIIFRNQIFFEAGKDGQGKIGDINTPYILVLSSEQLQNGYISYNPGKTKGIDYEVVTSVNLFDNSLRATIVSTDKDNKDNIKFEKTSIKGWKAEEIGTGYNSVLLKSRLVGNLAKDNSIIELVVQAKGKPHTYKIGFKPIIKVGTMESVLDFKNELEMTGIIKTGSKDKTEIENYLKSLQNYLPENYFVSVNKAQIEFQLHLFVFESEVAEGKKEYDLKLKLISGRQSKLSDLIEEGPKIKVELKPTKKIEFEKTSYEYSTIIWVGTVDDIKIPVSVGNIVIIIVFVLLLFLVFGITGLTVYLAYTKLVKMERKRIKRKELEDTDYFFD